MNEPEGYWALKFTVPQAMLHFVDTAFEDMALSISTFEADPEGKEWHVEVLSEEEQAATDIDRRLDVMASLGHGATPDYVQEYLPQQDWVSEVQKTFPPIHAGRYFIYGSHYVGEMPQDAVYIQIDAGAAFGSGEHDTTSTCLQALDDLARQKPCKTLLDMGCGSGILAIAMAKSWDAPIVAVDIDPIAVEVSVANAATNGVATQIKADVSDGYAADLVKADAPYDIIVANILARPLMELAGDLAAHLKSDGVAVLSGLLDKQEADVLAAHAEHGLHLQKRYASRGWHTLVLTR